ncbi:MULTISPECIES: glycosyltransferase [Vibrio]|uniref:glycosyltransferase n=1 Tax=Vibrio TaxID=662 RepID=UPI000619419B|nr:MULTISPECIES: glycosyltransferase [Vibrio]QCI72096.1 glycosyltransferase family 4 protein [Vibrio cyclitrophicus]
MRIITFHHNHSSNKGGIEFLIKHLKHVATKIETPFTEVFHDAPKNSTLLKDEIKLSNNRYRNRFSKIQENIRLYSFFCKFKVTEPTVFFCFSPKYLLFIPRVFKKKVKIVVVQANKISLICRALGKLGIKKNLEHIDAYTVYTEYDKKELLKFFPELDGRINVIPRGCRIETAEVPRKMSKNLVTIARVHEKQKNFSGMLKAFDLLPEGFSLDIYGDGDKNEIDELQEKIGQIKNVVFKGPTSDVAATLSYYSIFLMTSKYEGFGQTLIEARSQGLPVVVFDSFEALPWIIEQEHNGFIVPYNEFNLFSDAIKKLSSDEVVYNTFSSNALEMASQTEKSYVTELWISLLKEVFDEK